jgi:putative inorganic carbon (HCO3(-)) transporter
MLTTAACVLWYVQPALGPWPLVLIAAGRLARTLASAQTAWRRTPFDAPLLLFLLSALLAAGLAYHPAAGWGKFWVIVGGLALYDSLARGPEKMQVAGWRIPPQRLLVALLPALIAAYFLLMNDWAARMGKLPWLDPLERWFAAWQPDLPGHRLHPNVAGGLIAALLPMQAAAIGRTKAGWPLIGLALVGLLMSASRGAWIALALTVALWAVWQTWGRRWPRGVWRATMAGLIAAGALGMAIALWIGPVLFPGSRVEVLRTGLDLALDTPFTGLGLAGFQMAYSSYVLLIHVGHTIHSHNLFFNLWIEQGLVGLAAFGWALVVSCQSSVVRSQESGGGGRWAVAAVMALAVIAIHGLVDDAFYGSRGVLLLFVPFALLAHTSPPAPRLPGSGERGRTPVSALTAGLALTSALLLALLPGTRALAQANLGALLQTRAELSVYQWPKWPIQDALRRQAQGSPPPVDLAPAIARYRAALALDPGNAAANRRLGQIELSLGDYAAAEAHLAAAYARAPDQRATRQLLGETAALAGNPARAVALWRSVDPGQGQLQLRAWWYGAVGEPDNQQRITQAIRQLTTEN